MNRKNQILTFTISTVLIVILSGTAFGESVVNIDIDIKPGSDINPINNNGNGVIPVAIFGNETFDVSQINLSTVELEECAIKAVGKKGKLLAHIEDINDDGYADLVVQIEDVAGAFVGPTATLTGELFDGTLIEGTDVICIVP